MGTQDTSLTAKYLSNHTGKNYRLIHFYSTLELLNICLEKH